MQQALSVNLTANLQYAVAQVVFLPGFGCLYINVEYEKGTLVLSLAPEGSMDTVISQHSRYVCAGNAFMVVVLCFLHVSNPKKSTVHVVLPNIEVLRSPETAL